MPCSACSELTAGIAELSWRQGSKTALTEEVFPAEGHTLPSCKGLAEETQRETHISRKCDNKFHSTLLRIRKQTDTRARSRFPRQGGGANYTNYNPQAHNLPRLVALLHPVLLQGCLACSHKRRTMCCCFLPFFESEATGLHILRNSAVIHDIPSTWFGFIFGGLSWSSLWFHVEYDFHQRGTINLLANGAHKAAGMVALPQYGHHLSLYKFPAGVAERPMKPLEVQRAQILAIPHKEATLSHVTATYCIHTGRSRQQKVIKQFIWIICGSVSCVWCEVVCSDKRHLIGFINPFLHTPSTWRLLGGGSYSQMCTAALI